ncbi:MAG: secondary thiamine-phosphate synthase enzyme YjbQ [Planctomycetaceae bacterium]|nr:secondary thiamine-phosphate synthase enzyme YjbQ [Planctomycetaceae bacterium]
MSWLHREISLPAFHRGCHSITGIVLQALPEIAELRVGLLHIFLKHTSASLSINENADPDVLRDLDRVLDTLAPEDYPYRHAEEGPDDMPGHVKSSLLGCSLTVPIHDGRLCLGTWQGICLGEHRRHASQRKLVLTVWGEKKEQPDADDE